MSMEESSLNGLARAYEAMSLELEDEGVIVDVEEEVQPEVDYRFTVVGRVVTNRSVKFVVFHDVMAKAWKPVKGVHITEVGTGRFLFRFFHEGDVERVLGDGPWTFDQNLVVMRRIEQGDDPVTLKLDTASFWIQVHNLPSGFMSEKVAKVIGDSVGNFESADPRNFEGTKKAFMRVRVMIDIRKPLCV